VIVRCLNSATGRRGQHVPLPHGGIVHPAPRSGEGGPRVSAVEGASDSRPASAPHAPSTALRAVPLPRSVSLRGGGQTKSFSRRDRVRVLLHHHDTSRMLAAPKREAKRRKAQCQAYPRTPANVTACRCFKRGCAPLSRARPPSGASPRHSPPATTPMAQPQNRVSSRHGAPGVLPARRMTP
jgi:hypothetical protein